MKNDIKIPKEENVELTEKETESEFSEDDCVFDFALNGGLSFKFNDDLFLQARYSYGLTEIFENERYKNSVVSLSLGYFFK